MTTNSVIPEAGAAMHTPRSVSAAEFIDGLRELSGGIVTKQKVYEFLAENAIRPDDLERFKHWLPDRHTRNKIFRNDVIEAMVICWPIGAITPLHTHNGQLGWMTIVEGQLLVENYRKISCDRPENQQVVGFDCLAGASRIEMEHINTELATPGGPINTVDKTQTIHRIINPASWNERAVSLHIYSKPIDSCVVFDMGNQRCFRRDLTYDN